MTYRITIWLCTVLTLILVGWSLDFSSAAGSAMSESDIGFSHTLHVSDGEIECATCHEKAAASTLADDNLLPSMDVCGECHDVEDTRGCGTCHKNTEDPQGYARSERDIVFTHAKHLATGTTCTVCHDDIGRSEKPDSVFMPSMRICLDCHDGNKADDHCQVCHGDRVTLSDIHPADWRHTHSQKATLDHDWCGQCHRQSAFCIDCHRGDNIQGTIHDLNYMFTHGLDAGSKENDCATCHDREMFCNGCHESENRIPLMHSSAAWLDNHGRAARTDPENCASCHEADAPTCARSGCHRDSDGIRGTDPRMHLSGLSMFDSHGPWHDDPGYFCYQCHTRTGIPGVGFCGYCHH